MINHAWPVLAGLMSGGLFLGTLASSGAGAGAAGGPACSKKSFGQLPDGQPVELYTLTNGKGVEAAIMTYGGILVSLRVPDRHGLPADIVLGYGRLEDYVKNNPYFGCITGRYANRIARGRFILEGKEYRLACNNNENHLHGGLRGFDKYVWHAEPSVEAGAASLKLTRTSPAQEEGYPGNLQCIVTYTLTADNELKIAYEAVTDAPTVINLTHHSYFNLTGGKRDVLEHELFLNASRFTPVDATLIPTGELRAVAGTPLDFTRPAAIGARIGQDDPQLKYGEGYDHNFVLDRPGDGLVLAARVYEPDSGRVMEISTTEPGIQFYSGNFLDGLYIGKGGRKYTDRFAFCLETQHFPDSPNQPSFPPVVLRPGQVYRSLTVHRFSVR